MRRNMLVALAYRKAGSRGERLAAVERALAAVGLPGVQGKKVFQLSGGEQQRCPQRGGGSPCRTPPTCSPTSHRQPGRRQPRPGARPTCFTFNAVGKTVVVVTHDPAVANAACVTQRVEL